MAPPSSSCVTSSLVTVLTTLGPVTNMYDVSRTMNVKSVMAGEYTAPPGARATLSARTCRWRAGSVSVSVRDGHAATSSSRARWAPHAPAQGPMIIEICGMTPDALTLR